MATVTETTTLVVTTLNNRREISVPTEFLEMSSGTPSEPLKSYLRESGVVFPEDGMLTAIESGMVLHEVPKFG